MIDGEKFVPAEAMREGRALESGEKEAFARELAEYLTGLEAALADPDLAEEDRAELAEQLEALKDSQQAIAEGGEVRVKD